MLDFFKNNYWLISLLMMLIALISSIYSFHMAKKERNLPNKLFVTSKIGIPIYLLLVAVLLLCGITGFFIDEFIKDITNDYQDKAVTFGVISLVASVFVGNIFSKKLDLKNAKSLELYKKKKEIFNELLKLMSERLCTDKEFDGQMPLFDFYRGQLLMIAPEYQANIVRDIAMFWDNPRDDLYYEIAIKFNLYLEREK